MSETAESSCNRCSQKRDGSRTCVKERYPYKPILGQKPVTLACNADALQQRRASVIQSSAATLLLLLLRSLQGLLGSGLVLLVLLVRSLGAARRSHRSCDGLR